MALCTEGIMNLGGTPEGFTLNGNTCGVLNLTIERIDDLFMEIQFYLHKVVEIAKQLGTPGIVVSLSGESQSGDWESLLRSYGMERYHGHLAVFSVDRNTLQAL